VLSKVRHLNNAFQMPRWLSGLGYVLGLLHHWFNSPRCSHFFATQLLMYYDIATYSVFLQQNNNIAILQLIQCTTVSLIWTYQKIAYLCQIADLNLSPCFLELLTVLAIRKILALKGAWPNGRNQKAITHIRPSPLEGSRTVFYKCNDPAVA